MKIKVLSDVVINQIAAGEVVERPASVVRELVDNAVDAGATDIFIALESGGHNRIRVRDNGCGMTRDEALLAFERHATSKVTSIEDLNTLTTMGFRGEALASIAAVSKIKLTTRSKDASIGTAVTFRGGKLVDVQAVAWNEGTEMEVEHLFFNTPARRKFLKSPRSEVSRVRSWVAHSALSRPHVRYRLVSDGDEILNLPLVDSIQARGAHVFPGDLTPISLREGGVKVQGMIGHPGQALSDASGFVILINGRLVSDKIILRAAREGYDSMLKDREFPIGYLSLTMPPEYVDVNVHPQKSEVRFRHPDQVFAVVRGAVLAGVRSIKRPLMSAPAPVVASHHEVSSTALPDFPRAAFVAPSVPPTPVMAPPQPTPVSRFEWPIPAPVAKVPQAAPVAAGSAVSNVAEDLAPRTFQPSFFVASAPPIAYENATKVVANRDFRYQDLRYIGQLLGCYLVCEIDNRLVVVDMHAAHERVNYNKIREARAKRALTVQKLLIPERVRLTPEQVVGLLEQEEALKELAFEIAQVDAETVEVHGVPGVLSHLDAIGVIKDIAAEPVMAGWRERLDERIDHLTARLACHASVRGGDLINRSEAYALLQQLDAAETAGACPHGRPVVAEFSRDAVERWFGRDR
jgi:DNA mismatch repair protein MutL